MIGYYVHHVGTGHVQRARSIARHLRDEVTVLSSAPRPVDWAGRWIVLARDDDGDLRDVSAHGRLHWVPRRHAGLADRMATLARWIAESVPSVMVCDVSVEVALLARACGIPIVVVALPGERTDSAHQLAFDLADVVLAPWPDRAGELCPGLEGPGRHVVHAGGISRFDDRMVERRSQPAVPSVLFLSGAGGGGGGGAAAGDPSVDVPGWRVVRRGPGSWVEDPWPDLCAADVVVSHCGLGAVADIAAARRPAVLLPDRRPHSEQVTTARVLRDLGVAVVVDEAPSEWGPLLARARALDPSGWSAWSDGRGAERAAAAIDLVGTSL